MGGLVLPAGMVVLGGALVLLSYALIKPALFILILTGMGLAGFMRCLDPAALRQIGRAPLWLAFGMPLAAWLMPSLWLLYAAMVAMLLLGRKPGHAAPAYVFALLLLPGLDQTISAGTLKLFEFGVHDALAVGAAICVYRQGRPRILPGLDLPFVLLLLVLVTATARDTTATNFIRVLVNTVLDCGLPYYIFSRGIRSIEDLRRSMIHIACASTIVSVILVYEARTSWPLYNILYDRYAVPMQLIVKSRGGVLRAAGPFLESTSMAMVLVFCFLAAWLSRAAFRSPLHHLAVLALLLAGLTATQSRGAWIGLLIGMLAADMFRRRIWASLRRTAAIAGVLVMLVAVANTANACSIAAARNSGKARSRAILRRRYSST
jgi:hypothetical protein